MTRLYTRSGDQGSTGLADGTRTTKTSLRVEALGTVDESNACLGLLVAALHPTHPLRPSLLNLQHQLFDLGAIIAGVASDAISTAQIKHLENEIDRLEAQLPPLRQFILPGGGEAAARAHVARALCRRAERRLFELAAAEPVAPAVVQYMNRLSDLLFVIARTLAHETGGDTPWQPQGHR